MGAEKQKVADAEAVAEVKAVPDEPEKAAPAADVVAAPALLSFLRTTALAVQEQRFGVDQDTPDSDVERFAEQFTDGCNRAALAGETAFALQFINANYQLSLKVVAALAARGLPAKHACYNDVYVVRADW